MAPSITATTEHSQQQRPIQQQRPEPKRRMEQPASRNATVALLPNCSVRAANYSTASRVLRKSVRKEPNPLHRESV
jgi:hypothetical protein